MHGWPFGLKVSRVNMINAIPLTISKPFTVITFSKSFHLKVSLPLCSITHKRRRQCSCLSINKEMQSALRRRWAFPQSSPETASYRLYLRDPWDFPSRDVAAPCTGTTVQSPSGRSAADDSNKILGDEYGIWAQWMCGLKADRYTTALKVTHKRQMTNPTPTMTDCSLRGGL